MKESERIRGSESSKSGVKLTRTGDLGLGPVHFRNPRVAGHPKATTKRIPAANFVFSSFSHASHFFSLSTDELSSQAFFKTRLRTRISQSKTTTLPNPRRSPCSLGRDLVIEHFLSLIAPINDSRRIFQILNNFPNRRIERSEPSLHARNYRTTVEDVQQILEVLF